MAFIVTYALLIALSPFVITALPRAVARLLSPGARSLGWTIRHSTPEIRDPLKRVPTPTRSNWNNVTSEKNQFSTSGSGQNGNWTDRYSIQAPRVAPRHIPSLRTLLFPLSRLFNKTVGDYSVGQLIILAGYAAIIGFGIFFKSNPVTNPKRAGWIFISQLPVVVLLTTKNSLIGLLVGRGYEKLSYLHRWVGWVMFISVLFHVVSFRKLTAANLYSAVVAYMFVSGHMDESRQSYRENEELYSTDRRRCSWRVDSPRYWLTSRGPEPTVDHILLLSLDWLLCGLDRCMYLMCWTISPS